LSKFDPDISTKEKIAAFAADEKYEMVKRNVFIAAILIVTSDECDVDEVAV
jgi:hypothetical protein